MPQCQALGHAELGRGGPVLAEPFSRNSLFYCCLKLVKSSRLKKNQRPDPFINLPRHLHLFLAMFCISTQFSELKMLLKTLDLLRATKKTNYLSQLQRFISFHISNTHSFIILFGKMLHDTLRFSPSRRNQHMAKPRKKH